MNKFKAGDTVECLEYGFDRITKGKQYLVELSVDDMIYITDNLEPNAGWYASRFALVASNSQIAVDSKLAQLESDLKIAEKLYRSVLDIAVANVQSKRKALEEYKATNG